MTSVDLTIAMASSPRRSVSRAAARLTGPVSTSLGLQGIPSSARFPETLPTFLIGGYQQLGSPPGTASEFGTSVTQVADSLTWIRGHHAIKIGADLRWERLNVVQPPSPTGAFTFGNLFTDLPGTANTGTRPPAFCSGRCSSSRSISSRTRSGTARTSRNTSSRTTGA